MFSATLCSGDTLRAFPLNNKQSTKVALCSRLHITKENFIAGWQIETFDYQQSYCYNIEADRDWLWDGTNEYIVVSKPGVKYVIEYLKFKKHPLYGTGFEGDPFRLTMDERYALNKEYLHTLILEFITNIYLSKPELKVLGVVSCPQAVKRAL